jgi:hypothetical protein
MSNNFDFISGFVENLLDSTGDLTADQKLYYVPQVTALLEERIGLTMLPLIPEQFHEKYTELLASETATAEEWKTFWEMAVPNFQDELQNILVSFAKETKETLGGDTEKMPE